jgi:hypothetical protein
MAKRTPSNFLDEAEDLGEYVDQPVSSVPRKNKSAAAKQPSNSFLENSEDLGEASIEEGMDVEPSTLEQVINVLDIPGSFSRTAAEAALSAERDVIPAVAEQIKRTIESPTMAASTAPTGRDILNQLSVPGGRRTLEEEAALQKESPGALNLLKQIGETTTELAAETLLSPFGPATYLGRKLIRKPLISASEKQAAKAVSKYATKPMVGAEGVDPKKIGTRLVAEDLQGKLRSPIKLYEHVSGKAPLLKINPDSLDTLVIKRGKKEGGQIQKISEDITSMLQQVEKSKTVAPIEPALVGTKVIFDNVVKNLSATTGETVDLQSIQKILEKTLKPFQIDKVETPIRNVIEKQPFTGELKQVTEFGEKVISTPKTITITQVQDLRKNIGKLLSDRDFYKTPDQAMTLETDVLREVYRELGDTLKKSLQNVDVKIGNQVVNAKEYYEAQNDRLKSLYDIQSMLEYTDLNQLKSPDLNSMIARVLGYGGVVGSSAMATTFLEFPQYATAAGAIGAGTAAGLSAVRDMSANTPEYLTSIFKQAAKVAPAATAAGTQGTIMYMRNGQFVPSLQEPTPEDILKFKLPTTTQGFIQNKKMVLAKLAQEGFAGEQIDAIAQALNGDEVDLSDSVRVLYSQFPGVFDRYTSKNGKRYAIFDGEFIDPEQKSQAADQVSKRKDLNSIQKAKMISTINSGELPEGL